MVASMTNKYRDDLWLPSSCDHCVCVCVCVSLRFTDQYHPPKLTNEFVATLLEASNNVSNQSPLDAVWFDCQEGALLVGSWNAIDWQSLARGNGRGQRKAGRGIGKRRCANEGRQSSTIAAGSRDSSTDGGGLRLKIGLQD